MGEISCILRVMKFADETYQISPRQIEDNRPEKYLMKTVLRKWDARGGKEEEVCIWDILLISLDFSKTNPRQPSGEIFVLRKWDGVDGGKEEEEEDGNA